MGLPIHPEVLWTYTLAHMLLNNYNYNNNYYNNNYYNNIYYHDNNNYNYNNCNNYYNYYNYYNYRLLRWIGYFRFELNVWVWSPFLGRMMSPKTGLFLTFWKVNRRKSRRSGCLKKNTVLFKILGKNRKNCLSLSNCVISNPLEQKKLDIACFRKVLKTIRFKQIFVSPNWILKNDLSVELDITFLP